MGEGREPHVPQKNNFHREASIESDGGLPGLLYINAQNLITSAIVEVVNYAGKYNFCFLSDSNRIDH